VHRCAYCADVLFTTNTAEICRVFFSFSEVVFSFSVQSQATAFHWRGHPRAWRRWPLGWLVSNSHQITSHITSHTVKTLVWPRVFFLLRIPGISPRRTAGGPGTSREVKQHGGVEKGVEKGVEQSWETERWPPRWCNHERDCSRLAVAPWMCQTNSKSWDSMQLVDSVWTLWHLGIHENLHEFTTIYVSRGIGIGVGMRTPRASKALQKLRQVVSHAVSHVAFLHSPGANKTRHSCSGSFRARWLWKAKRGSGLSLPHGKRPFTLGKL
jgi:hypothetical protein